MILRNQTFTVVFSQIHGLIVGAVIFVTLYEFAPSFLLEPARLMLFASIVATSSLFTGIMAAAYANYTYDSAVCNMTARQQLLMLALSSCALLACWAFVYPFRFLGFGPYFQIFIPLHALGFGVCLPIPLGWRMRRAI